MYTRQSNFLPRKILCIFAIISLLAGCSPSEPGPSPGPTSTASAAPSATMASTSTSTPSPEPTATLEPAVLIPTVDDTGAAEISEYEPTFIPAGERFEDPVNDIDIPFLDVVAFTAMVDEGAQTVEAVFEMRDVPETAPKGALQNVVEYSWGFNIYLDPNPVGWEDVDYSVNVLTITPNAALGEGPTGPVVGQAITVPFNALFFASSVHDAATDSLVGQIEVIADPSADTITFFATVPGITEDVLFEFYAAPFHDVEDWPGAGTVIRADANETEESESVQDFSQIYLYPGPTVYQGEVVTLQIPLPDYQFGQTAVDVWVDDDDPVEVPAIYRADVILKVGRIVVPEALDTAGLSPGRHTLHVRSDDLPEGIETVFEVRPASTQPQQERDAVWQTRETACCVIHYLANTAAARDIEAIAEQVDGDVQEVEAQLELSLEEKIKGRPRVGDQLRGPRLRSNAAIIWARDRYPARSRTCAHWEGRDW